MPIYEIFFALGCVIVIGLATLLWNVAHESDSTPIIVLDDDVDDATRVDYNGSAAAANIVDVDIVDDRLATTTTTTRTGLGGSSRAALCL